MLCMNTFSKTYLIEHSLEKVYTYWISNSTLITPVIKIEIDPWVGGVYRLELMDGSVMSGKFSQVSNNKALSYSWQWQGSDEITRVDVQFHVHVAGTEVQIKHGEFLSEQSLLQHAQGWDNYISGFKNYLMST